MLFSSPPWDQVVVLIGELTLLVVLGVLAFGIFVTGITLLSIKRGKFYFPRLLSSGFIMLEGVLKGVIGFFGLEDRELVSFFIRVHNSMNARVFEDIPVSRRAIFFPQCLRSSRCPAHLTPEGLSCQGCGACEMGRKLPLIRDLGYRIFIVPGSSFIQRMVKKYRPSGIIGVGCIVEVRDGLEMCDRMGLCGMGVVTLREGCVETLVSWQEVFETAMMGMDPSLLPEHLDVSAQ